MNVSTHATSQPGYHARRINWPVLSGIAICHALAALAFLPWFFSWTGVVLCVASTYIFGTLGVNVGYHRLLTHRGFQCPKWLEHVLVLLGVCTMQGTPGFWVAVHRRHHQFADHEPDPHSPLVSFFWAHMGWIFFAEVGERDLALLVRYAADVLRDPFYVWLERYGMYVVPLLSWTLFFLGGWGVATVAGAGMGGAVRFGASLLIWGAIARTVLVWHITWSVNSVTHFWGYRTYQTNDGSRNNPLIGFIANGEGWHNNHHADPRSARHGHQWWELDVAYLTIRALEAVGLASDIALPSPQLTSARPGATQTTA